MESGGIEYAPLLGRVDSDDNLVLYAANGAEGNEDASDEISGNENQNTDLDNDGTIDFADATENDDPAAKDDDGNPDDSVSDWIQSCRLTVKILA